MDMDKTIHTQYNGAQKPKILKGAAGHDDVWANFGTHSFLERREAGIFNLGGKGFIEVDGTRYDLGYEDCLYISIRESQSRYRPPCAARGCGPAWYSTGLYQPDTVQAAYSHVDRMVVMGIMPVKELGRDG